MTVFYFRKNIECVPNCHENFSAKVKILSPSFENGVNGHITLLHSKPYHRVWITFYNGGKHENWTETGIEKKKFNKNQKKFKGDLPTKSELENL
jgi:hypothetical protein